MAASDLHIIHNGEIFVAGTPVIDASNRAFCYGDAIFETMHACGSEIQFVDQHFERLFRALEVLKINIEITKSRFIKDIQRLINRDKLFGGVRVRLCVYRDAKGLFTPAGNTGAYIITCQPLENQNYVLNPKGLHVGVYDEVKKSVNKFSEFKTANSLLNVMAGIFCREQQLDDCLIKNENQLIIEGFHSNLFIVKNNMLFTPPVSQGCVNGIMRQQIINIAQFSGLNVVENISIKEELLPEADEIFLTNAIEGIRWVLAYKNRRFFNKTSKFLIEKLNEIAFK